MEHHQQQNGLLELIPDEQLSSQQKAFHSVKRRQGRDFPHLYKLLREPGNLEDIEKESDHQIAIWCDNETVICIGENSYWVYKEKHVSFKIRDASKQELDCTIYGMTDAAIAETLTLFLTLQHSGKSDTRLKMSHHQVHPTLLFFDFAALQAEQLARILDANQTRLLDLCAGTWNAKQSEILATRTYPLNLRLSITPWGDFFAFTDGGTAFVNALETRQSSFGSFAMKFDFKKIPAKCMPFRPANLKRLFKQEIIEKLAPDTLPGKCVLLPFATKVDY